MAVKFITDSASDLLPEQAKELGVTCIPINISFGEESYDDAVNISHEEFYEKLAVSEKLPVTSQISPLTYSDYYKQLTANGDEVVVVVLSSELSGTYQNAVLAAKEYPDKVFVVDCLNATVGQRILVMRGLELAEQGCSAKEIADILNKEKQKVHVVAIIDTLEYLKKGGRISSITAVAGTVLGIKPAVEVKDGKVVMAGTARGQRKAQQLLKSLIEKYGGINWDRPVSFVYSAKDDYLRRFIENTSEMWKEHPDIPVHSLGGTIGTHIGPNGYGIAFFAV